MRTTRTTRTVLAAAAAAALLPLTALPASASTSAATGPYKGLPNGTKSAKTLVIGIDGTRYDKLLAADAPNLKALMSGGMTATGNLYANPLAPTLSGPGWSTIATGVWPDKHGVKDNTFAGSHFDTYPDVATRLETASPGASTLVAASWNPSRTPSSTAAPTCGSTRARTTRRPPPTRPTTWRTAIPTPRSCTSTRWTRPGTATAAPAVSTWRRSTRWTPWSARSCRPSGRVRPTDPRTG
ncbi:hypothetical protein GCM10025734_76260 [Kitasatospora paranensis]